MSLQDEVAQIKVEASKSVDVYYSQCNAYAQKYMLSSQTEIQGYKITKRDFQNNVISNKLFDYRNCGYDEYNKMSDKDVSNMFQYE